MIPVTSQQCSQNYWRKSSLAQEFLLSCWYFRRVKGYNLYLAKLVDFADAVGAGQENLVKVPVVQKVRFLQH